MDVIENALNKSNRNAGLIEIDNYLSSRFHSDPSSMTQCEVDVVFVENLEREVNNGGFNQFFWNSSGDHAHETLTALRHMGAHRTVQILEKAMDAFPNRVVPTDMDERREVIDEIEDEVEDLWDDLDEEFDRYEDNLGEMVLEYVRANRDQFR